jgi:hypothetical protein
VTCLAVGTVSSLSVAVDLWLALLRLGVRDGLPQPPFRPPRDDVDLAKLIEKAVLRRVSAVTALVDGLAPPLLPRVHQAIGPSGLRGWLLPTQRFPAPPEIGGAIEEHLLHYVQVQDGVYVESVAGKDEIPEADNLSVMSAESYLQDSAQAAARKIVIDALVELMPRFDA